MSNVLSLRGRNRFSPKPEMSFVPAGPDEIHDLILRLRENGVGEQTIGGVVLWLIDLTAGRPQAISPNTKTKYRKALEELAKSQSICTVRSSCVAA